VVAADRVADLVQESPQRGRKSQDTAYFIQVKKTNRLLPYK
jgi:hypothetical protein